MTSNNHKFCVLPSPETKDFLELVLDVNERLSSDAISSLRISGPSPSFRLII